MVEMGKHRKWPSFRLVNYHNLPRLVGTWGYLKCWSARREIISQWLIWVTIVAVTNRIQVWEGTRFGTVSWTCDISSGLVDQQGKFEDEGLPKMRYTGPPKMTIQVMHHGIQEYWITEYFSDKVMFLQVSDLILAYTKKWSFHMMNILSWEASPKKWQCVVVADSGGGGLVLPKLPDAPVSLESPWSRQRD